MPHTLSARTRGFWSVGWILGFCATVGAVASALAEGPKEGDIAVIGRRTLPVERIACQRIALGEPDDYKPCLAKLPDGELLLSAFHQYKKEGGKLLEQNLLFRSTDGGQTWFGPEKLDLLGREPYLTVLSDGTVLMTGHLLAQDVRSQWTCIQGFLHRSTDRGRTWQSIRLPSEGIKPGATSTFSRNVAELADGTLLVGADYSDGGGPYFVWRSTDRGKTWDRSTRCNPVGFDSRYSFFQGEAWLWPSRSGKIIAFVRVDSKEHPLGSRSVAGLSDHEDHEVLYESTDRGLTFRRNRDFGECGQMYPSLLRLQDGRMLYTFTVRGLHPQLGVHALVGTEQEDGFSFDFQADHLVIETRTPPGKDSGGGFGPTVQLADGTLLTSYSYRGTDEKTHLEIARWRLPAAISRQ